jgi:hypothetical protein
VCYSRAFKTGIGRRVARGPSLANFTWRIRATLAWKYYNDLDMFATHFMIIISICLLKGWECTEVQDIVDQREANLQELVDATNDPTFERGDAKRYTTKLLYGSSGQCDDLERYLYNNVSWVKPLVGRMFTLRNLFWNAFPNVRHVKSNEHSDPKAAHMSNVINMEEDRVCSTHWWPHNPWMYSCTTEA